MTTENSATLTDALGNPASDRRLEVLRLVGQSGSISQAARVVGISYKAAWQAIDTLTNLAGLALVDRAVGGAGGGGAQLTAAGEQLLDAARQMDLARREVLARFSGGAAQALPGAGLRTSMRNNLPCRVTQLMRSAPNDPMVRVGLTLPHGGHITSSITRESAELLGLQPGLAVLALCKATALRIRSDTATRLAAAKATQAANTASPGESANLIAGKVARLSRGAVRDEVVMTLPGELQLVGFAEQPNRLRVGSNVMAILEENAVVLALV